MSDHTTHDLPGDVPEDKDSRHYDDLILGYLEGLLDPAQMKEFDSELRSDPAFSRRFIDTALLLQSLQSPAVSAQLLDDAVDEAELPYGGSTVWESVVENALASKRRSEVEHEAQLLLAQDKVGRDREARWQMLRRQEEAKAHQTRLIIIPKWSVVLAIAAILALVALPLLTVFSDRSTPTQPQTQTRSTPQSAPVLATLVRSLDARWADGDGSWDGALGLRKGSHRLTQGLVEIELLEGARIVLEAPVSFTITSANAIVLSRGRMVADVPSSSVGFTVETPTARIVDFDTEFGVDVGNDAGRSQGTQIQVYRGEVSAARLVGGQVVGRSVTLGRREAAWVDRHEATIEHTVFHAADFERRVVQRLDLVDIVAGGDGLGDARMRGIHPQTGRETSRGILGYDAAHIASAEQYKPVRSNPLIDGVFIPHRSDGIQIDSTGTTISGLAVSDPRSYGLFWAGGLMPSYLSEDAMRQRIAAMYRDDPEQAPVLYMISNKGITFDLQALRGATGSVQAIRFLTEIESIANSAGNVTARADIHIYLDGEPVDSVVGLHPGDDRYSIEIVAQSGRRFLTVVVADGGDGLGKDWIVLHQPVLEVLVSEASAGASP